MKQIHLFSLLVLFGATVVCGQFRAEIAGGIPIGDARDLSNFSLVIDMGYLFDLSDNVKVGPTLGYSHSFGDQLDTGFGVIEIDDTQFIPIAAAARFNVSEVFSLGADLGYAFGLENGTKGGLYYAPRVTYSISNYINLVAAFRGISLEVGSWDIISLGLELNLD